MSLVVPFSAGNNLNSYVFQEEALQRVVLEGPSRTRTDGFSFPGWKEASM